LGTVGWRGVPAWDTGEEEVDSRQLKVERKKNQVQVRVVILRTWGAAVLPPYTDASWRVGCDWALCVRQSSRRRDLADMGRSVLRPYVTAICDRLAPELQSCVSGWGVCRRRMKRRRQRRL
jgi:hypothetical protein